MKFKFLTVIAGLIFMLTLAFQTAAAQTGKKIPAKESSLISYLVKEANEPDSGSADYVYLVAMIGKTEYIAELKSGKVVKQKKAEYDSGGFYGAYAEVNVNLMNKSQEIVGQGAGQLLKLSAGKWKRIALNETDYQCSDVKTVPKAVLKALKVECN